MMQPHREGEEHSRDTKPWGQGLRDAWKVWDLASKGQGGAHLTAVGEKVMRTSRVTALLTLRSRALSPAGQLCCPDCSSLWDKGAVGQGLWGLSPPTLARPLPEPALPQAGTRAAPRAPQLRAVLGQVEHAGDVVWVLLLHRHAAAPTGLITPVQVWGGWEQVTTGHHGTGWAPGARAGMGGETHRNSCPVLQQHLQEENMEKEGKTLKSRASPPSVQREEKAGESGSHQVLKEQSCSYMGFKNTRTAIRAGEGKTSMPEWLTKEILDC